MPRKPPPASKLDALVERMFEEVLSVHERTELLEHIRAWEAANPGVDPARRVTAWIDLAYELQAARRPVSATHEVQLPSRTPAVDVMDCSPRRG